MTARRILIIEPNEITRKLIAGILGSRGFESMEAADGDAAMNLIAGKQPPELVIFDADVEGVAVEGFLVKMKASYAGVPLVALSGEEDGAALKKRLGLKDASILAKPVMPDSLFGKIEKHVVKSVEKGLEKGPEKSRKSGPDPSDPAVKAARDKAMRRALDLAQQKSEAGHGGPFAAVVTRGGKVIGEGWDAVLSEKDPMARAEIIAIGAAARAVGGYDLSGCEIHCVCEPGPLGLAAIYEARIDRVFYACTIEDADALGFDREYLYREIAAPEHKRALPAKMTLHDEGKIVLDGWAQKGEKTVY